MNTKKVVKKEPEKVLIKGLFSLFNLLFGTPMESDIRTLISTINTIKLTDILKFKSILKNSNRG